MGMINDGLTHFLNGMGGTSRIVLGMILGGMMSIDMGGPFNKAAYVFGTAQLAEGNFEVMAAVMAGGMVPPIAIALCTTFFKKKFTEKERQSGIVNYVMGLSFITEGAIPFAAQDPLRVIPSCVDRFSSCRRSVHGIRLYAQGTSRRHLCPADDRQSAYVSGGGGCRFRSGLCDPGIFKEGRGVIGEQEASWSGNIGSICR